MKFRVNTGRRFWILALIAVMTSLFLVIISPVRAQDTVKETEQLDFAQGLLSRGMYDMAILQYQKFITDYPHSPSLPDAYLSLGEGYFQAQDFDKAVAAFNQFNQLYPNSDRLPVSLLRLAQIDIQQNKYDDALKELTSGDAQKQLKGEILQSFDFYIAQAYLGKSDAANALDYFQKASQVDGASVYTAEALEEAGKIFAQTGRLPQAMDAYDKSMQSAREDALKAELAYRTAEVQFLSGKYEEAVKAFWQFLEQHPDTDFSQSALANMLLAYFNLGQYDHLLAEYQKNAAKIKNDESSFSVHFAAALAYIELKQYDQANALLDRMLAFPSLKPLETSRVFVKKASVLIRQKKYKDALALLDAYSSADSDDADEALFLKAQGHYGLGEFDRAFGYFGQLASNFPNSRYAKGSLLGQAHAKQAMGAFKEAEALFLKYYGTQEDPSLKSDALYDAVMTASRAGDTQGAMESAQEYLKAFPNSGHYGEVLIILSDTYDRNKQPQEALKILQDCLSQNQTPAQPNSLYFLLGYNQQLLGHTDDALAAYAKVDRQKEGEKFYLGALKNMAIIYLNQKKPDLARDYFDRLITQGDQNQLQLKTYVWVCNEYLKELKFNDVLRIAAQAEKRFTPSDLQKVKYFKAEALQGLGRCDEADTDYEAVITGPRTIYTAGAQIGYGLCLEKGGQFDKAKEQLQKALDENPDDYTITAHARFEMANLEASQGHLDDALKLYLLVATIYDNDHYCSESLLRAAEIFQKLKRNQEALKMYAEVLDKYKNTPAATTAKERMSLLK